MIDTKNIEDSYANFISEWDWQWFATLTFRGLASKSRAERRFEEWINTLKCEVGHTRFRYVRVTERGETAGLHFHLLVGGLRNTSPNRWIRLWEKLGGDAQIEAFDEEKNGIRYILKTLSPDGDIDIEFEFPHLANAEL